MTREVVTLNQRRNCQRSDMATNRDELVKDSKGIAILTYEAKQDTWREII